MARQHTHYRLAKAVEHTVLLGQGYHRKLPRAGYPYHKVVPPLPTRKLPVFIHGVPAVIVIVTAKHAPQQLRRKGHGKAHEAHQPGEQRKLHRVLPGYRRHVLKALDGGVHEDLQVAVGSIAKLATALAVEVQRDVLRVRRALTNATAQLTARLVGGKPGHVLDAAVGIFQTTRQATHKAHRVVYLPVHVVIQLLHVLFIIIDLFKRRISRLRALRDKLVEVTLSPRHTLGRGQPVLRHVVIVPPHQREHTHRATKPSHIQPEQHGIGGVFLNGRGDQCHRQVSRGIPRCKGGAQARVGLP